MKKSIDEIIEEVMRAIDTETEIDLTPALAELINEKSYIDAGTEINLKATKEAISGESFGNIIDLINLYLFGLISLIDNAIPKGKHTEEMTNIIINNLKGRL